MKELDQKTVSDKRVIALCLLLTVMVFIFDSLVPLGVAGGVPYVFVVLVALWSKHEMLPVYMAILGSVLTVAGYFSSPEGGVFWVVIFNRALALGAIWVTAILSVQRKRIQGEREAALADLKILSGLLPVCSWCKKISDEKGHWEQIESYVSAHSEAQFSHDICPDCEAKLDPVGTDEVNQSESTVL